MIFKLKNMFKTNSFAKISSVFILSCTLFACGTEHGSETDNDEIVSDSVVSDVIGNDASSIAYFLPSPLEIASVFKKSGMKFQEEYLSKNKEPQKYVTTISKALNLGVYSSDLSYALLNKQNQTVMEYMKLSSTTATSLGLGNAFQSNNIMKRFEKNIGTIDSLTTIMSEIQMEMDLYLDENDQKEIGAIAFTGAWFESMHIVVKVNESTKSELLIKKFTQQLTVLESIANALKANVVKEPGIQPLLTAVEKIKSSYDNLMSVKNNTEENKNSIQLTEEEIAVMATEIESLRNQFINGEFK